MSIHFIIAEIGCAKKTCPVCKLHVSKGNFVMSGEDELLVWMDWSLGSWKSVNSSKEPKDYQVALCLYLMMRKKE